jgi:hypothetical protein
MPENDLITLPPVTAEEARMIRTALQVRANALNAAGIVVTGHLYDGLRRKLEHPARVRVVAEMAH